MKILHTVEFYSPSVGGMQEVVKQLSERLVELGHDVTVATTKLSERKEKIINGVKISEFDVSGNLVRGLKGDIEKYENFLIESDFDVVVNFAAQQWATDISLSVASLRTTLTGALPTGASRLASSVRALVSISSISRLSTSSNRPTTSSPKPFAPSMNRAVIC